MSGNVRPGKKSAHAPEPRNRAESSGRGRPAAVQWRRPTRGTTRNRTETGDGPLTSVVCRRAGLRRGAGGRPRRAGPGPGLPPGLPTALGLLRLLPRPPAGPAADAALLGLLRLLQRPAAPAPVPAVLGLLRLLPRPPAVPVPVPDLERL